MTNYAKKIAYKYLSEKQYKKLRNFKNNYNTKSLQRKKTQSIMANKNKTIYNFKDNWEELMTQKNICDKFDKIITPRNIELISNYGSECICCDLDFPIGLSIDDMKNALPAIAQNIYGNGVKGCMAYVEEKEVKGGVKVQFSAVKTWHNAPFTIPKKKLTASELFLGYDINMSPIIIDMSRAPHLLITGASGSGKSILVQIILTALAYHNKPEDLELYFIQASKDDTWKYELLKHCKGCVTASSGKDMGERFDKIITMLQYINDEIDRRGALVKNTLGRRAEDININIYNKNVGKDGKKLPVLQLWVDEAATMNKESSDRVLNKKVKLMRELTERISATGRFVGIYLINTLQRASKDELSREVKINTSNWVSFKQVDAASSQLAIGDEKSALGLPQRVFVVKDGRNSRLILGKTPFSTWDKSLEFLDNIGVTESDESNKYLYSRYTHWNTYDNEKIEENNIKNTMIKNTIVDKIVVDLNNEIQGLHEKIYEMELELKSKDLTIKSFKDQKEIDEIIDTLGSDKKATLQSLKDSNLKSNITAGQKEIASNLSEIKYKEAPAFDFSSLGKSKVVVKKENDNNKK